MKLGNRMGGTIWLRISSAVVGVASRFSKMPFPHDLDGRRIAVRCRQPA